MPQSATFLATCPPEVINGHVSIDQIKALEQTLINLPRVELNTENLVHGNMCARTILIPAGTVLTGVQTNADNICVLCGNITVTTSGGVRHFNGFHVLPADAGFKRAGVAHEDTYWTTIHHTDLVDMEEIEKEMTPEYLTLQDKATLTFNSTEDVWLG